MVYIHSTAPTVHELAADLVMKTLIVWCSSDRIFHVSGSGELANRLKKPVVSILDQCGHVPMLNRPDEVAAVYLAFLRGLDY